MGFFAIIGKQDDYPQDKATFWSPANEDHGDREDMRGQNMAPSQTATKSHQQFTVVN